MQDLRRIVSLKAKTSRQSVVNYRGRLQTFQVTADNFMLYINSRGSGREVNHARWGAREAVCSQHSSEARAFQYEVTSRGVFDMTAGGLALLDGAV